MRTVMPDSGPPSSVCRACAPGRFVADNGSNATLHQRCANCSAGLEFNSTVTPCSPCLDGWHQDDDGTRAGAKCTLCAAGKQHVDAKSACVDCEAGSFQPSSSTPRVTCSVCDTGRIASRAGAVVCADCGINTYNGFGNAEADRDKHDAEDDCVACPVGQLTHGNTGSAFCSPCAAGKRTANDEHTGEARECVPCPTGRFQPAAGSTACEPCEVGRYQGTVGQPFCLPCVPGRAQHAVGSSSCRACAAGQFHAHPEGTTCALCPRGFHQPELGSTWSP